MPSLSLRIPNLSESLEYQLESMILSGIFWPQSPLPPERRLAEEMGVSRTSVRNALAGLCDKKLLMPAKRGYLVSPAVHTDLGVRLEALTENNCKELLVFWASLAEDIMNIAKVKAKNSDRVAISTSLQMFTEDLASGDVNKMLVSHKLLWKSLSESTYNFFIGQTMDALIEALNPYFLRVFVLPTDQNSSEKLNQIYDGLLQSVFEAENVIASFLVIAPLSHDPIKAAPRTLEAPPPEALMAFVNAILRQPYAFESVFELRLLTERLAAQWAAARITAPERKELAGHIRKMSYVVDTDKQAYSRMDSELHAMIAELSGNAVNSAIHQCLNPIFSRTTESWLKTHYDLLSDYSVIHIQHQRIVTAILNNDRTEAGHAMDAHLAYVLDTLNQLRLREHYGYVSLARQVFR